MEALGFKDIQIQSIRDEVFAPFSRYAKKRLEEQEIVQRFDPFVYGFMKSAAKDGKVFDILDYVVVSAVKP